MFNSGYVMFNSGYTTKYEYNTIFNSPLLCNCFINSEREGGQGFVGLCFLFFFFMPMDAHIV